MKRAWQTIVGYIWWTYPRGSAHYDVMVTVILLFLFLTPLPTLVGHANPVFIDFNDKPVSRTPHPSEVAVYPDGQGLVFQVSGKAVTGTSESDVRASLFRVIEPIAGEVTIDRYEAVKDHGRVVAYKAWVRRGP